MKSDNSKVKDQVMNITYEEFEKVDLRSGTIVKVEEFPRAKKPASNPSS